MKGFNQMIKSFGGINISSKNPESMAKFYNEKLGIPILTENPDQCDYDGVELGFNANEPVIWIWNENNWGKSNFCAVTFVFRCENLDETYHELKEIGVILDPPITAVWGGKELNVKDPDGNNILMLDE